MADTNLEAADPPADDDLARRLEPVFLEPREDRWLLHRPADLSPAQQQAYQLAPRVTAEQLAPISYCEDCFPQRSG